MKITYKTNVLDYSLSREQHTSALGKKSITTFQIPGEE